MKFTSHHQILHKALFVGAMVFISHPIGLYAKAKQPNVLFIVVDDLKPLLGCYGDPIAITPHIDQLAEQGIVFENAHCQQAICGPSRASLLTGLRPDTTRVWDLATKMRDINPNLVTMPQYFKEQGYETAGIGKVYDSRCVDKKRDEPSWSIPFYRTLKSYFAEDCVAPGNMWQDPETVKLTKKYKAEAIAKGIPSNKITNYVRNKCQPTTECLELPDNSYPDGAATLHAKDILVELSQQEKPFFFAFGLTKPHLPFTAPKKYWDLYDRSKLPLAAFRDLSKDGPTIAYHSAGELRNYGDIPPLTDGMSKYGCLLPDEKQKELIHGYYAAVTYADSLIGQMMDSLKTLKLEENTIVVLVGDHGWHLGDHNLWCKHSTFEQATRVPFIICAPKMKGMKTSQPTEFVDIFPTLCDLTQLDIPPQLEGTSLVPVMKNLKSSVKEFAVSQYPRGSTKMGYSLRTECFRYTVWMDHSWRSTQPYHSEDQMDVEMYDYQKDPNETQNVVNDPLYAKESEKLRAQLLEFFASKVKKGQ